jgi:hypothetical protein
MSSLQPRKYHLMTPRKQDVIYRDGETREKYDLFFLFLFHQSSWPAEKRRYNIHNGSVNHYVVDEKEAERPDVVRDIFMETVNVLTRRI